MYIIDFFKILNDKTTKEVDQKIDDSTPKEIIHD